MAGITLQDAQRELHNFAMDEMRNRGINAALEVLQKRISMAGGDGKAMYRLQDAFSAVARLRVDPGRNLSDWWATHPSIEPDCFYAADHEVQAPQRSL